MKERKKEIAKFLIAFVVIISVFLGMSNQSYATETAIDAGSILNRGSQFITTGSQQSSTISEADIATDFVPIGKILIAIATVIIFIVMAIMGIKWITATPDKQAVLKQQLIGLVVAIIVIYGAVGIWAFVRSTMESLTAV